MEIDEGDFKQLIVLLQKLVENQTPKRDTSVDEQQQGTSANGTKKKSKKAKVAKNDTESDDNVTNESVLVTKSRSYRPAFSNKFSDMPESKMHKDDSIIDKKLNRLPPSQRTRRYEPISVSCRVCGRKEKVNPVFVESSERYKCNKCSTSAG